MTSRRAALKTAANTRELFAQAEALVHRGRHDDGAAMAQGALDAIGRHAPPALEAEGLRVLGLAHNLRGAQRQALVALYRALELYEAVGDRIGLARTQSLAAVALGRIGSHSEALGLLASAMALAEDLDDADTECRVWHNLAAVYRTMGDLPKAMEALQTTLEKAQPTGNAHLVAHVQTRLMVCRLLHGQALHAAGDSGAAAALIDPVLLAAPAHLAACRAASYDQMVTELSAAAGASLITRGEHAAARELISTALVLAMAGGQRTQQVLLGLRLAEAERAAGLKPQGLVRMRAALALADEMAEPQMIVEALQPLARACEEDADLAGALQLLKRCHAEQVRLMRAQAEERAQALALRIDIERTRHEAQLLRLRAAALESDNRALASRAAVLDRQAHEDPLTTLGNRRWFDESAAALIDPAAPRRLLTIAVVDIDHFKRVNDDFSHAVGDQVLRALGAIIKRCFRPHDVAARFGGEEFVIAFVGASPAQADRAAERLRASIAGHDWSEIAPALAVTASIGLAGWAPDQPLAQVLARADEALYAAKRGGRNRVCRAAAA